MRSIRSVLVAGSGVMGRGVARAFARGGYEVAILSRNPAALDALPPGVRGVGDLGAFSPDMVVDNVPEDMALKRDLLARCEEAYPDDTILATNTSTLPLDEMGAELRQPDRFIGLHYLQPADAFPLVEVIRTSATADWVVEAVVAALPACGQAALMVNQPIEGFLINRLQHAILREAYFMIEAGICSVADVDAVAKRLLGPRMCVTGLIEQKDIANLETHVRSHDSLVPHLASNTVPTRLIHDLVDNGHLGVKTGRGFYDWSGRDVEAYKADVAARLKAILAIVEGG